MMSSAEEHTCQRSAPQFHWSSEFIFTEQGNEIERILEPGQGTMVK